MADRHSNLEFEAISRSPLSEPESCCARSRRLCPRNASTEEANRQSDPNAVRWQGSLGEDHAGTGAGLILPHMQCIAKQCPELILFGSLSLAA